LVSPSRKLDWQIAKLSPGVSTVIHPVLDGIDPHNERDKNGPIFVTKPSSEVAALPSALPLKALSKPS
jgi:hypothetical protein